MLDRFGFIQEKVVIFKRSRENKKKFYNVHWYI